MSRPGSAVLRAVVRLYRPVIAVLAIGGIGIMLWRQRESFALLRQVGVSEWAAIAALMALNVSVFGLRVRLVLQRFLTTRIAPLWWQRVFVTAFALNSVLPQAGAVYRGVELKRAYDMDVLSYVRGYYFIAWCGVLFILLYGTTALALLPSSTVVGGWNAVTVGVVATAGVVVAPFAAFAVLPGLVPRGDRFARLRDILQQTLEFTRGCVRDTGFVLRFAALSVWTFAGDVVILAMTMAALGFDVPLAITIQMFALMSIFGLVRITPGNIGVQELVVGAIGVQAGLTLADGIVLSLLTRALRALAVAMLFVLLNLPTSVRRVFTRAGDGAAAGWN